MEELPLDDWRCPVCNAAANSQGLPFGGSRAVALHVAGKVRTGDGAHKRWAIANVGDPASNPRTYRTINTLGYELESYVIETNQARIEKEHERIQRLVDERDSGEKPSVLAYKYLDMIEPCLHQCVLETLQESYGENECDWWVQGVPANIRVDCAKRREEDTERDELFNYTNLIHLKTIIERNRPSFEPRLVSIGKRTDEQREFLESIARCNDIRNRVAHPVRKPISAEEVAFLKAFYKLVAEFVQ